MLIQGTEVAGWATPILDDPERSSAGFRKLRPWTYKRAEWTGAVFVEVEIRDGDEAHREGGKQWHTDDNTP